MYPTKNTIRINGKVYNCEIVNDVWVKVNGQPVMISWKQGQYGSKVYRTELSMMECNTKKDGTLTLKSYWNNSDRQVKDANAYLLNVEVPEPPTGGDGTFDSPQPGKVFYKGEYRDSMNFGSINQ